MVCAMWLSQGRRLIYFREVELSKHSVDSPVQVTVKTLQKKKQSGEKISMVTCYDAAFGLLVDRSGIDTILVGDSLGNVVLGFKDTIAVTMEHMIHHTAAVSRSVSRALLIADMPFLSYNLSVEQALRNAGRLIQEGGAHAVKLEGGAAILPQVKAIVQAGIPVVGHLGLTPQSVHQMGGYKIQGRGEQAQHILDDAKSLASAGASALVLELVPQALADDITRQISIPTIGIGAGPGTDGQVLVLHDLLGFNSEFNPKFLKKYANLGDTITQALSRYDAEVKAGQFPNSGHSFQS
ncbi:MAG: 3-methyl-2-oxobutanoate hydroxymethyltransferase [Proteobacteria bacterium]|nr:3-methyl-2-oxobutanoate hydroxymethyltransferase [Pseudomonadota bacterium]